MRERSLQLPWLRLGALEWGAGNRHRVLALHGWLDNAASFGPLAAELDGIHLVALDLPGHGHSDHRPAGVHYHFVDFVPDVLMAADALGWESFTLLGHSLGAGVAAFAAATAPERVERLALIEGLGPHSGQPEEEPARLARAGRQMARSGPRRVSTYDSLEEAVQARLRAGGLTHDAAEALVRRSTTHDARGYHWRSDARLRYSSPLYLSEPQVLAFLQGIACPTRFIRGRQGSLMERPGLDARMAAVARLEGVVLDGGHHLHLESPRPVAADLLPFLHGE